MPISGFIQTRSLSGFPVKHCGPGLPIPQHHTFPVEGVPLKKKHPPRERVFAVRFSLKTIMKN